MQEEAHTESHHRIELNNRKTMQLTGVRDVHSFDEQEILLETQLGVLLIRGSKLHIGRLSLEQGEADVDGRVDSLLYTERKGHTKSGDSFFRRLFQ